MNTKCYDYSKCYDIVPLDNYPHTDEFQECILKVGDTEHDIHITKGEDRWYYVDVLGKSRFTNPKLWSVNSKYMVTKQFKTINSAVEYAITSRLKYLKDQIKEIEDSII